MAGNVRMNSSKSSVAALMETGHAQRQRNRMVHDPWVHKGDHIIGETFRLEIVAQAKLKWGTVPADRAAMHKLAVDIEKQRAGFARLCGEIDDELGTVTQASQAILPKP